MRSGLTAAASIALAIAACSKLTVENYAQVKMGMSFDEVKAVLGSPEACDDAMGLKDCRWGDERRGVSIKFAGDKVIFFSAHNIN